MTEYICTVPNHVVEPGEIITWECLTCGEIIRNMDADKHTKSHHSPVIEVWSTRRAYDNDQRRKDFYRALKAADL